MLASQIHEGDLAVNKVPFATHVPGKDHHDHDNRNTDPCQGPGYPGPARRRPPAAAMITVIMPLPVLDGAKCRPADTDLFFGPEHERAEDRRARLAKALELCMSCPARTRCRQYALEGGEQFGIWGGADVERVVRDRNAARRRMTRAGAAS